MLDKPTKLYVGSLPYDFDDSALREIFSKYGEITEVSIVQEEDTGKSRGFGFVTFKDQESADAAIDGLNETSLGHRNIMVQYAAKPGTDGQPATRGGRGGYRGAHGGFSGRGGYGGGF